ncbi:hypothetical protein HID58_045732 [Brassica napus]|uniref:CCHC-type domain-containing protein n=1 Tax=Brassica napus TaxID=3708 RepID=A0ABQ8AUE6_BRANA|nr:hypothetical protein HID58_045732 [Brassica napus]
MESYPLISKSDVAAASPRRSIATTTARPVGFHRAANPASSSSVIHRCFSSESGVETIAKKKVEDVMPIATGHEKEELEAELEVIPLTICSSFRLLVTLVLENPACTSFRNRANGGGYVGGGGGGGGGNTCYTCGGVGHMARVCTSKRQSGGGGGGACYECGGIGHLARDCDRRGRVGGGGKCFTCGEEGHFARDCYSLA